MELSIDVTNRESLETTARGATGYAAGHKRCFHAPENGPTVDDINPALPILKEYTIHSLGSLR